ncbi:MAG TPA: hypothetical protein VKN99_17470 [Polyangia bacterium]|nr:hypothetical protein [Polyangia bacterium]
MRALGAIGVLALCMGAGCFRDDGYPYHGGYGGYGGPLPGDPTAGFTMTWKLVDSKQPGDPVAAPAVHCADAHVANIRLDALNSDTSQRYTWSFACDAGNAITPDVTVGKYTVTVDALDAQGVSKSRDSWVIDNTWTNDLGLVVFVVDL